MKYDITGATVTAKLVLGVFEALRRLDVDPQPYIERYQLQEIRPDEWVLVSTYLSLLQDIQDKSNNFFSLISVGKMIVEIADRVPNIETIYDIFNSMNDGYHLNHRGGEIGNYFTEILSENHIRVTAENPYPSDFDYGLVWGVAKAFCPQGTFVKVVRAESPCRLKGNDRCIYDITW